jgi:hypothetical protein
MPRNTPTTASASRLPPDPRKGTGPFTKPVATPADAATKPWLRVYSGLGLVRTALMLVMLAVLLPVLATILENNGVPLPQKNPGLLDVQNLSMSDEIKCALALVPFLLGTALVLLGRLRVSAVPRMTCARGMASAATFAQMLGAAGFVAALVFIIGGTLQGSPPRLGPSPDALGINSKLQSRIESTVHNLFLDSTDMGGQIQRYGATAFLVFGFLAEVWFFIALGRIATHLGHDSAAGRVSRLGVFVGMLVAIALFAALWYDLDGRTWWNLNVLPKWNTLTPALQKSAAAGIVGFVLIVLFGASYRAVGGVRRAVREVIDSGSVRP